MDSESQEIPRPSGWVEVQLACLSGLAYSPLTPERRVAFVSVSLGYPAITSVEATLRARRGTGWCFEVRLPRVSSQDVMRISFEGKVDHILCSNG